MTRKHLVNTGIKANVVDGCRCLPRTVWFNKYAEKFGIVYDGRFFEICKTMMHDKATVACFNGFIIRDENGIRIQDFNEVINYLNSKFNA